MFELAPRRPGHWPRLIWFALSALINWGVGKAHIGSIAFLTVLFFQAMIAYGAAPEVASAAGDPAPDVSMLAELREYPHRLVAEVRRESSWELIVFRADGKEEKNLTRTPDRDETYPKVSPDGSRIAFVEDQLVQGALTRSLYLMNMDATGRRLVARGGRQPFWKSDGSGLGWLGGDANGFSLWEQDTKGLFLLDLKTGAVVEPSRRDVANVYCPCFSADGRHIFLTAHGGLGVGHALMSIDVEGQGVSRLGREGCRSDISPDGKRLAWTRTPHALAVAEIEWTDDVAAIKNAVDVLTCSKEEKMYHVDWSPDGRYLAFSRGRDKMGLGLPAANTAVAAPGWNLCIADVSRPGRWARITKERDGAKEPDWINSEGEEKQ